MKFTMKKSLLFVMLLALFASFSTIHAQMKNLQENSALLYEISGKNLKKPSYLFGTIHIICSADMISKEKFEHYISETEQVIMELDFDNQAEIQSMGTIAYLANGKTLADFLTAEQYAKVGELVKDTLGIPIENVKNLNPIILQSQIIQNPKTLGCKSPGSYEYLFLETATAKKKTIEGLETVMMQIDTINSIPLGKQAEGLYQFALEPKKTANALQNLVEIYKSQNVDRVYKFMQATFGDDPTFQVNLLDKRNTAWIPKIEKAVKEKSSFIAVGVGHLGGKTGVLNLLRAKGLYLES